MSRKAARVSADKRTHGESKTKKTAYIAGKGGSTSPALLKRYAYKVTQAVKNSIATDIHTDPVAKQYIPRAEELKILPEERTDPIGDDIHSPLKGLVHRYPDRVLLKLANVCAVYCRYCFRREMIGPGAGVMSEHEIDEALNYIRNNTNIQEVILTGGDPLVLSPSSLEKTLIQLDDIEHVQTIRIHSRIPIADPEKISKALCRALDREKPIYMVVHINHAQEITTQVERALRQLHKAGCVLLSQSVLLKGVNDDVQTLETLFKALITLRVKPYYLHHPDLAPGTSHFRLSIREGQRIFKQLLGRISGICRPHYMLDIPGGGGKVPLNNDYVRALSGGTYEITDYQGRTHIYTSEADQKEANHE